MLSCATTHCFVDCVACAVIRVEAEHSTNVGKQRAFTEAPLPSLERERLAAATAGGFSTARMNEYRGGEMAAAGRRRRKGRSNLLRADLMAQTTVTT